MAVGADDTGSTAILFLFGKNILVYILSMEFIYLLLNGKNRFNIIIEKEICL